VVTVWAKLKAAGAWLVKHWQWFLFPLGVLTWLVGRASAKTTIKVASPELVEHFELQNRLDAEAKEKLVKATEKRDAEKAHINQTFEQVSANLDAAEARQAEVLKDDPEALTAFLKGVGRDVRAKPRS
jgi:hypothetical protein